ncbi:MAG: FtsK/SpoIIIE family protein [uncultured Blastococcus sp.]|uniref:FtsK/SpoIIIE family protein n=1 Tax=uncultured Blastococcus sp. TaxID=217144 RepID=A0A6J4HR35_9ACTN|nr:MAG: FtsK/SpoIIIE family protein [uncultured Blastococcus sp.]
MDVEVTAADDETLGEVVRALTEVLGAPVTGLWAGSSRLADDLPLRVAELAHGAVLGLGRPVPRAEGRHRSSALELHVVGGPEAGRSVPLGQGRHVLGRSTGAGVRIDDADVSREHVAIQVGGGAITVVDLGSSNGSRLGEEELTGHPRAWRDGDVLRLGGSAVTISGPEGSTAAVEPGSGGRMRVRPTPVMTAPAPDVEIAFPRPPSAPPRRRLAWVAVALPAVGGGLMAWLLHTPTFLFFALLSPVVALGTWLSERWSGRRSGRLDDAAHALEVLAAEASLTVAVRSDIQAADAAHPDLAALTLAARRRSHLLWSRPRREADGLSVRIGSGAGPTRVTRVHPDGSRSRETAPHLPVVVDLRQGGGLALLGPRDRTSGVVGGLVVQLTALYAPGEVDLLLLTDEERLPYWRWVRWLPHLAAGAVHVRSADEAAARSQDDDLHARMSAVAARRRAATAGAGSPGAGAVGWLVVLVDRPLDPRIADTLRNGRDVGVLTLTAATSAEELPVVVDTVLRLAGETGDEAVLSRQGHPDRTGVVVDRLPRDVGAVFARDLAALAPVWIGSALPRSVRLLDLPPTGLQLSGDGTLSGAWTSTRDRLIATVGQTAQGPFQVDLCRQGPHALVAGTTGSGKSELLQTLIAGLALNHPPDRCSFLLVDYKGGAAFAEAADLPHTVGVVTDLDGQTTARALRSLTAELTRREALLAAHRVADLAALPDEVDLARLVIVVDEFATLAEELPAFVPGLVAIAQRGRSLGVHLVLATQRPGGVVSPEIRANSSLRICLRTTDEADSRDVLGTTQAAHLPTDLPGRALLRAGTGTPTALQVARVAAMPMATATTGVTVRPWPWPYAAGAPAASGAVDGDSDLARLSQALVAHARAVGAPEPHRPWRAPLPDLVTVESLASAVPVAPAGVAGSAGGRDRALPLGLVDRPDTQSQHVLELDLAAGGALLAVGGPRSGRTSLLRTVLAETVHRFGPEAVHVHVLDAGAGSLADEAAGLPHTGTVVAGDDALRAVRLVDRLAAEVAARRTLAGSAPGTTPLLLLLVDGAESLSALLDEHDPGRGSAHLLRLIRDGAAVGLTCVLTADRAVPGGRLASVARRRLVLPLPDRADYAVAGVPPRAVPAHRPPGRALLGEEAFECQLAVPRSLPPLAEMPAAVGTRLQIVQLPPDPRLPLAPGLPLGATDPAVALRLPVGPGGDEGAPLVVDLSLTGGLLISGPGGSGRSAALRAFAEHLESAGVPVLRIGRPPRREDRTPFPRDAADAWLDPTDTTGVADWMAGLGDQPGVLVADDVTTAAEWPVLSVSAAARPDVVLLASGATAMLTGHYQGPVAALRRSRSGLLLCPGPGDAELFGVRLPRTPLPVRPGSGWLVTAGAIERVQVARRRAVPSAEVFRPAPPSTVVGPRRPQRSSSTGPISCVAYQASS